MSRQPEDCEYNPVEKRAAFTDEQGHAKATWSLGSNGQWHVCDECAALPEFKMFRKRVRLK